MSKKKNAKYVLMLKKMPSFTQHYFPRRKCQQVRKKHRVLQSLNTALSATPLLLENFTPAKVTKAVGIILNPISFAFLDRFVEG